MNIQIVNKIKSPEEIKSEITIDDNTKKFISKHKEEIKEIIEGKDSRKILIIGPCSAWPEKAVLEYAARLKKIDEKVSDKIKIILRVYTQKPRTTIGWSGCASQPDPFENINIKKGIEYSRKMMIEVSKIDLAIADEIVIPEKYEYFEDILSWIAIGARTTESQLHRMFASGLDIGVGFKNTTQGNIEIAVNSIIAASNEHEYLANQKQIKTLGNKHSHLILRGGDNKPNYDIETIKESFELIKNNKLNKSIIIDASHDNSLDKKTGEKEPLKQREIIHEIITQLEQDKQVDGFVKGFMVESFIEEGNQRITTKEKINMNGLSITDACIGWENTVKLIDEMYETL